MSSIHLMALMHFFLSFFLSFLPSFARSFFVFFVCVYFWFHSSHCKLQGSTQVPRARSRDCTIQESKANNLTVYQERLHERRAATSKCDNAWAEHPLLVHMLVRRSRNVFIVITILLMLFINTLLKMLSTMMCNDIFRLCYHPRLRVPFRNPSIHLL